MQHSAVIAGAGESPYSRHPPAGWSTVDALADAARRAITSAGLTFEDIDGLAVASFSLAPDHAIDLAWKLGLRLRWIMEDTNGGASGINMLQHAARAIEYGDARHILILAGDVLLGEAFAAMVDRYNAATRDYLAPLDFGGPNALFAMLTQRHMAATGLEARDYGRLVIAQREWAAGNPGAVYREPLTLDDYLKAPLIAEPLRQLDCVPVVAGADAIVVSSEAPRAVGIRALSASYDYDLQQGDGLRTGLHELAGGFWSTAAVDPADVDIACVYDDYPAMVYVQLADMGLTGDQDLAAFVNARIATRKLPVNTSGGQLSAGQAGAAGGLHGLVEAVTQLRGEGGARQVPGARLALVTGYGMVLYRYGACANAVLLERL